MKNKTVKRISSGLLKKIVIKVGSSIICDDNNINISRIKNLAEYAEELINCKINPVIVTSGAIAAGMQRLNMKKRPTDLPGLQAAASAGQSSLMAVYDKAFIKKNKVSSQILLTRDDFYERQRYLNITNTFNRLIGLNAIPVVNENDTVAVEEIKFGDNDTLSALVAVLIDADLLVILTDINGVHVPFSQKNNFLEDFKFYGFEEKNKDCHITIKDVFNIPVNMEKLCSGAGSHTAIGGMSTKIHAARITTNCGIPCVIADGFEKDIIDKIIKGKETGTYFYPLVKKKNSKKRWIGYGSKSKGVVVVDYGAKKALLEEGRSLLSSGILTVKGVFFKNDTVDISDESGSVFAKGLIRYSSGELKKIKGMKTCQIENCLGNENCHEAIHRDNLILL